MFERASALAMFNPISHCHAMFTHTAHAWHWYGEIPNNLCIHLCVTATGHATFMQR